MNYFWLEKHIKSWHDSIQHDRKPQAVIINGDSGVGKIKLLNQIIEDLLCRKSTPSCGQCQNCVLNKKGFHPDVDRIVPENSMIKVKMIRTVTEFFTSTPHCSDFKVAVIQDAHLMNSASANALLKVLEEPPKSGLLFLTTDSKHRLMPTIRSRCVTLDVTVDQDEKLRLRNWLSHQDDSPGHLIDDALVLSDWLPLKALNMLKSEGVQNFYVQMDLIYSALNGKKTVSEVAKKLSDIEGVEFWNLLQRYMVQILKIQLKNEETQFLTANPLNQLFKNTPKVLHIIVKFADLINLVMINFNTQIKKQLMVESMLIDVKNELDVRR